MLILIHIIKWFIFQFSGINNCLIQSSPAQGEHKNNHNKINYKRIFIKREKQFPYSRNRRRVKAIYNSLQRKLWFGYELVISLFKYRISNNQTKNQIIREIFWIPLNDIKALSSPIHLSRTSLFNSEYFLYFQQISQSYSK